jgi:hypothetical protein
MPTDLWAGQGQFRRQGSAGGEAYGTAVAASPNDYRWLSTSTLEVAGCVTVVAAADELGVKKAFGADSDLLVAPEEYHGSWGRFVGSGEATVVIEDNGYQGSRSEVLRAASKASASGKAASVFWNVNDLLVFSCARRGKLLASVELLDVDEESLDGVPKSLHRLALSVNDEGADALAIGAAMVEKFTGASFGPEVLHQGTAYALTPSPDELQDFHPSQMWLYEDYFPELFAAVVAAPPGRQRAIAVFAAHVAAHEIAIEDQPAVRELLDSLERGEPHIPPAVTAADAAAARRADAAEFKAIEDRAYGRDAGQLERMYLNQESWVWRALRQATHPDPVSAAVIGLRSSLWAVALSASRYAAVYVENDTGRYLKNVEDLTVGRQTQVADLAMRLLDEAVGVDDFLGDLPTPLTQDERAAALQEHQERFDRGEFSEYQIGRY